MDYYANKHLDRNIEQLRKDVLASVSRGNNTLELICSDMALSSNLVKLYLDELWINDDVKRIGAVYTVRPARNRKTYRKG